VTDYISQQLGQQCRLTEGEAGDLGELSLATKHYLLSPAKDAVAGCAEFMERFQALHYRDLFIIP